MLDILDTVLDLMPEQEDQKEKRQRGSMAITVLLFAGVVIVAAIAFAFVAP